MLLFKLTEKIIAALLTLSLMLVTPAFAKSASDWVAEGNQAFNVQEFDAAISAYDKALAENPGDARILYNKACALYMNKDYASARDLFEKAALKAKDAAFEAKTHFNMGNAELKNSTNSRDADLKNTMEGVERSVAHYEKALSLSPEMTDAAHNLEMARMTLQKIQDELEKQKQAAEKKQKEQQAMEKDLKELIDQQQALSEKIRNREKQPTDAEKNADTKPDGNELAREQAEIKEKTRKMSQKMAYSAGSTPQDPMKKAGSHLNDAADRQKKAEEKLNQSAYSDAREDQEKASEAMKKALAEMQEGQTQNNRQEQADAGQGENPSDEPQKTAAPQQQAKNPESQDQEPAAMRGTEDPEKILEEENQNRRRRHIQTGGNYRPVEKDW